MDRYEDEEKQFRDELFFTFHVELAPWTGRQLVVEMQFKLQPDCFCNQAVCHYNLAISPTENSYTSLNTTQKMLPTQQWSTRLHAYLHWFFYQSAR